MKTTKMIVAVASLALLGTSACADDDSGSTQAAPVAYPAEFPVQATGSVAEAASWYEVSGLASGMSYLATLAGPQVEPDYDLEIYSVFEPIPPNELCTSYTTGSDSCSFVAPGGSIFVGVLNLSAIEETYSLDFTLN